MFVLVGIGQLFAIQDEAVIARARKHTDALNTYLMNKARGSGDIAYLASPVTGSGITVRRFPQLFLLALAQGKKQPSEWAQAVWSILQAQGQTLIKDGKTLESADENIAELTEQAQTFAEKQLPILKMLQIA